MAKLYFKYGVMGSSKTANALIAKFDYEEDGSKVLLIKPSTDTRDGDNVVKSRIESLHSTEAMILKPEDELAISSISDYDVIICDESQFFTPKQIERFKHIAVYCNVPVMCYGLLTDFQTNLFPGSKRLIELADSLQEIKKMCKCKKKATVNARLVNGRITQDGEQVMIGGNESYKAMCYECWNNTLLLQEIEVMNGLEV